MSQPNIRIDRVTIHVHAPAQETCGLLVAPLISKISAGIDAVTASDESPRFELSADGATVTDHKTGLQWAAEESPKQLDFEAAEQHCASLRLGGFDDWRLPDLEELESIRDLSRHNPCIDTAFFKSNANWVWSRTPTAWSSGCAWFVLFNSGHVHDCSRHDRAFVRAVRRVSPAGQ
ncbi:MAG TPA: DUF1566 domain-containing protein [Frateuria sp.]|uniref:Lcl C-terminal domain-containing protein n=1 Tax=Frateuria sp. TaxID=2211372 RepID=UPI002D80708C|nr:DUF1566 domain-containing protein [Frateuria sp.]HET6805648.1 DUF1566 domain-containing protein [Frateuria sp.]